MSLAPDDPRHGTRNGYGNLGCRCQPCRDANTSHQLDARKRRRDRLLAGLASPPHGRETTYFNWMCRCRKCKDAHAAADGPRRRRRTTPLVSL